jgi:hypothetical protein
MNKVSIILISALSLFLCAQPTALIGNPDPPRTTWIDLYVAFQVVWMHDQERLAMDLNQVFSDKWGEPLFASLAASKPQYMDKLMYLIDWYEISAFGEISNEPRVYTDERHAAAFAELSARGVRSVEDAYLAAAYVEEWNILEYGGGNPEVEADACDYCEGIQLLTDAFKDLLSVAYFNLAKLASQVDDYSAQILSQADVDAILAQAWQPPEIGFFINGGLTDVWYDPATSGQGFFIAVYEKSATVFLSWLTYDTDLPDPGVSAHLGAACQRWLTAQGHYDGALADLVIYSANGGVFDASQPVPVLEPVGFMTLQFDDCNSGTVSYNLPGLGESGSIPIQRLAADNAVVCKVKIPVVP